MSERHLTIMVLDSDRPHDPTIIKRDIGEYRIDLHHKTLDMTSISSSVISLIETGLVVTIDIDNPKVTLTRGHR